MFKLNKKIIDSEQELDDASVEQYIKKLKKENLLIIIDNVLVDAKNLVKRRFSCDLNRCIKKKKLSNKKINLKNKSCFGLQEILLSKQETKQIEKIFPYIKNLLGKYRTDKIVDIKSILEKNRYNQYILKKTPGNKHCILSYFDNKNILRCVIHTVCINKNLSAEHYKPYMCSRWPLEFFNFGDNKYLLTACSREAEKELEDMAKSSSEFSCMRKQSKEDPPLYIYMKDTIIFLFGRNFWKRLDNLARSLLK